MRQRKYRILYGKDVYEMHKEHFDKHPEVMEEVKEKWDKPIFFEMYYEEEDL